MTNFVSTSGMSGLFAYSPYIYTIYKNFNKLIENNLDNLDATTEIFIPLTDSQYYKCSIIDIMT